MTKSLSSSASFGEGEEVEEVEEEVDDEEVKGRSLQVSEKTRRSSGSRVTLKRYEKRCVRFIISKSIYTGR